MFKELLKELLDSLENTEKEQDLKPFHITIKHGEDVIFDKDTNCAFVVANEEDGFYSTCYNKTNMATTVDMLRTVTTLKNKMVDEIGNKILGD